MSETYKLNFTRWALRGVSETTTCTAMEAMTTQAYERMVSSEWTKLSGLSSNLPPHKYRQSGFLDTYDACKFCGDYDDDTAMQKAYAAAVCYTIKIPADALAGTKAKIEQVAATLYGDRWTSCGTVLAAILTSSPTPPAWADVLAATYSSPDPVTAVDDADPTWQAPLREVVRSNTTATGDPLKPDTSCDAVIAVGVDATAYLHVVLRLGDYIPTYLAWVEGGAMLLGSTLAVTFDRAVTPDSQPTVLLRMEYPLAYNGNGAAAFGNVSINAESRFHFGYVTPPTGPASIPGDSVMMRKVLGVRDMQSLYQISAYGPGATAYNSIAPRLTEFGGKIGCVYEDNTAAAQPQHSYRLHGLFLARSGITGCETVDGISFVQSLPAMPAGQVVRVAMYLAAGPIPFASNANPPLVANIPAMETAASWPLVSGIATSVKLGQTGIANPLVNDAVFATPPISVSVSPLGHYDIIGPAGISANTKIPFFSPVAMPRFAIVFVAINVIDYTAAWVAAPATTTAVAFQPTDINLHVV